MALRPVWQNSFQVARLATFRKSDCSAGNLIWNPFRSLNVGNELLHPMASTACSASPTATKTRVSPLFFSDGDRA